MTKLEEWYHRNEKDGKIEEFPPPEEMWKMEHDLLEVIITYPEGELQDLLYTLNMVITNLHEKVVELENKLAVAELLCDRSPPST